MATTRNETQYQCPTCQRSFKRQSHLQRHLETHRDSQRWPCEFCENSYTRRDALNRHLARRNCTTAKTRVNSFRKNRSCQGCSDRKLKCPRGQPCARCTDTGIQCVYPLHGSCRRSITSMSVSPAALMTPLSDGTSVTKFNTDLLTESALDESPSGIKSPSLRASIVPPLHGDLETIDDGVAYGVGATITNEGAECTPVTSDQHMDVSVHGFDQVDPFDTSPWLSWNYIGWNMVDPTSHLLTGIEDPSKALFADEISLPDVEPTAAQVDAARVNQDVQAAQDPISRILDPVENHRLTILAHVIGQSRCVGNSLRWLDQSTFPILLKTYFTRHHRHTPIIHLPTFNIVSCPTSLIFAIALIAAAYIPKLGLRSNDIAILTKLVYDYALATDERYQFDGSASLQTLQVFNLVGILDRFMIRRRPGSGQIMDLNQVACIARRSGLFKDPGEQDVLHWSSWAVLEARRRIGLITFAFDAFVSVLYDETPNVLADEVDVKFPCPEYLFTAASEVEWKIQLDNKSPPKQSYTLATMISIMVSNAADESTPLPNTLMGRFVLLDGILNHAYRTKKLFGSQVDFANDKASEACFLARSKAIDNALRLWQRGWPDTLLDYEPTQTSPSLYHDRAVSYWHLAGILTLPHMSISTPNSTIEERHGHLTVYQALERLMILSDHDKLDSEKGFDETWSLITQIEACDLRDSALSSLFYREADTTKAGFE